MRAAVSREWAARLAAIAVLGAMAGWVATGSLQQDFAAYYTAGAAVARGLDPYLNHAGEPQGPWDGVAVYRHSRFLYPPLLADLMRPVAALPYAAAKVLFTALSAAALIAGLWLAAGGAARLAQVQPGPPIRSPRWGWLRPLAAVAWVPVFLCLERGQVDLLLLAALAAAWAWRDRPAIAGALLAFATLLKPALLIVVPLLICARRRRWAAATLVGLGLFAAATVAISGAERARAYVRDVLPRAARYGEGGPAELLLDEARLAPLALDVADGVARIDGRGDPWPVEIGPFSLRRNASLPRWLAGDDAPSLAVVALVAAALAALLGVGAFRSPEHPAWYWSGALAGVVAAPVSWAMGLVWALLLFAVSLDATSPRRPIARAVLVGLPFGAGTLGALLSPVLPETARGGGVWVIAGLGAIALGVVQTARSARGDRAIAGSGKGRA